MLLEYIAIAVMIGIATFIAFAAIGLGELFGTKKNTAEKSIPYESGITPFGEGTRRMPIRFYLIAVMFILFDIEVVFFLPWAIALRAAVSSITTPSFRAWTKLSQWTCMWRAVRRAPRL